MFSYFAAVLKCLCRNTEVPAAPVLRTVDSLTLIKVRLESRRNREFGRLDGVVPAPRRGGWSCSALGQTKKSSPLGA